MGFIVLHFAEKIRRDNAILMINVGLRNNFSLAEKFPILPLTYDNSLTEIFLHRQHKHVFNATVELIMGE